MAKNLLLCLLALMQLTPAVLGAPAQPLVDTALPEDIPLRSLLPYQDEYLLNNGKALYTFRPGQPGAEILVAENNIGEPLAFLFAQGQQLWGLDAQHQALVPLAIADGLLLRGQAIAIPLHQLLEDQLIPAQSAAYPEQALVFGDRLLLLYRRDDPLGYGMVLFGFDLQTGQGQVHQVTGLQLLASTPQGSLIALTQDTLTAFDPAGRGAGPLALHTLDLITDSLGKPRAINLPREKPTILAVADDTHHRIDMPALIDQITPKRYYHSFL